EDKAGAALQVEAETHFPPLAAEDVDAFTDTDRPNALFFRPGNEVRQIAVGVGWPGHEHGERGKDHYERQQKLGGPTPHTEILPWVACSSPGGVDSEALERRR